MATGNVPRFIRLESGSIVNLDHVIFVQKTNDACIAFVLGLTQPVALSENDFEVFGQASDYSESLMWLGINELPSMSSEKSLKLLTELIMHFVAHSISFQQGALESFPLEAVYQRIANIMNEINTSTAIVTEDNSEDDEGEEQNV